MRITTLAKRMVVGARWGAVMGVLLSAWAGILALAQGSTTFKDGRGTSVSAMGVIVMYLLGGVLTGSLFGACLPLIRRPIGAGTIGVVAATIVGAMIGDLTGGQLLNEWRTVVAFGLFMGVPGGLIIRGFVLQEERESERQEAERIGTKQLSRRLIDRETKTQAPGS